MYRLMIVEDELLARLALKNSIAWEKYNIDTIIEARDGMEALEKFRTLTPDILIVDINIPIMNGMELIKEIRKENQKSKIIILSCLEDFKYATEAIKEGVSEYILKASMSIEEIEVSIKNLIEEMNGKEEVAIHKKRKNENEEYRDKSILLRRLLSGELILKKEEKELFTKPYRLAVFKVEFIRGKNDDLAQELLNKMNFVKNIIASTMQGEYPCQVIVLPEEYYVAYIEETDDKLKYLLENTAHLIQKYTSAKVIVGVSDKKSEQADIAESLQVAKKRLGYYAFDGGMIYLEEKEAFLEMVQNQWVKDIQKVKDESNICNDAEISNYLDKWPALSETYLEEVQNYWIGIINRISFVLEKEKGLKFFEESSDFIKKMRNCKKQSECLEVFSIFARTLEQIQESKKRYSPVVEQAIAYAKGNYSKPITLVDTATHIAISPNYLSPIFKKECGVNFTEYVTQLRIGKAKVLLQTTNRKLFEIAQQCGFNDHTYFTKTFKKQEGISPNEYKKQINGRSL